MWLHTANRNYCTHATTHRKRELLHTCGYIQQTGVTANMRLHTATGVTAYMGLHINKQELLHTCGYTQHDSAI